MATQPINDYYASQPPFATKEERMVTEALQMAAAPSNVVRGMVTRPLFPPKYGYRTEALGVLDCLNIGRVPDTMYNVNYTGGAWDINASSRNSGYSSI